MSDQDHVWFEEFRKSRDYELLHKRPIAYFCAEYAISDYLQTYSGGLGILSGDTLREASDQKIPVVAVGLFYRQGYYHHEIQAGEVVLRNRAHSTPEEAGLTHVVNTDGSALVVTVPVEDRVIYVQAWRLQIGFVSVYLLDTDLVLNSPQDRMITDRLYVTDRRVRLLQEMVLGIGGMRLLDGLDINPCVYHMNEGHSAFLALELVSHELMRHHESFTKDFLKSRDRIVFTNHTLLPAGNETFSVELVRRYLAAFASQVEIPLEAIISLGRSYGQDGVFSMTTFAMNVSSMSNAVSKIHADKAHQMWPQHPIIPVTNGIHIKSWDSILAHEDMWTQHQYNKEVLLRLIREATGVSWGSNELLIGWARRIVSYKRPLALMNDIERLIPILNSSDRPVRIVISGHSHESDIEGAAIIAQLSHLIDTRLNGSVVYLPNYQKSLAAILTAGTDVWLNTPSVGTEACGTSGMKACLNGSLPLTTRDGWVGEIDTYGVGWALATDDITSSILDELQYNIVPMYYASDRSTWVRHMHHAREVILRDFSTTRMLRQYIEEVYKKSIETSHEPI